MRDDYSLELINKETIYVTAEKAREIAEKGVGFVLVGPAEKPPIWIRAEHVVQIRPKGGYVG